MKKTANVKKPAGQRATPHMGDVYDNFAEAFRKADELPTWKYVGKGGMVKLLSSHLRPGVRFLDLGSASARVEAGVLIPGGVLAEDMAGIEISPEQVRMAQQRIPGARFLVGDVSDPLVLAGEDTTFDVVFSHMVFEHLDDEQLERTCQNAFRLLKQGGVFAFIVTHPDKMTDAHGNLVQTYGEFITTAPWGGELHNWRRSVADTRRIVQAPGFTITEIDEIPFPKKAPTGLSAEDLVIFTAHLEKYSRYPAMRLAVSAVK